jgi:hypothetical protein
LLAACDKTDNPAGAGGGKLVAVPLPYFASYDTWCAHLGNGVCKGDWDGHVPGTSALGAYRFVLVEYTELRDGQGPARDVFLELVTPKGNVYFGLGRTRKGQVTTSVMVHEVVDRPGALELRTVFRTSPRFTQSDYHNAIFILEGPRGLGVVEVPLGKIVGDDTGKTSGAIGNAQWQNGKLSLKGAAIADGMWTMTPPELPQPRGN